MTRLRGFTAIELLIVIGVIAVIAAVTSLPLATMQTSAGLTGAVDSVVDGLRRAQLQATSGYYGSAWSVHFSDGEGCVLPASKFHIYSGTVFDSATDTIATVELTDSSLITALALGGGCDVNFARYRGTTTNAGTVTVASPAGQSKTVTVSSYGRVSR